MGIITRLNNMVKSKINNVLDEIIDPIELLDQKIRDMEENLNKAKISAAQVFENTKKIKKKLEDANKESTEWDEKVKVALKLNEDTLAKKALERKLDVDKRCENLNTAYTEAQASTDKLKERLRELEDEIEKTRKYRDEAAARYLSAEASKKVNEIIADVSTESNGIRIDDIERKIQKKEAYSEGLAELKTEDPLKEEFAKLNEKNLDEELAKYKAAI